MSGITNGIETPDILSGVTNGIEMRQYVRHYKWN